jgi:hypothetical protein
MNDPQRPRRWTQVSRLFSVEAYLVMVEIAAQLMGAVWIQGRALHLGETADGVLYQPTPPPSSLFDKLGVPSHVLTEQYRPLEYEGESSDLIMKIAFPPRASEDDPTSPGR